MAQTTSLLIELTREQQLAVLAATGLRLSTLHLSPEAIGEDGEAPARIPLPEWLVRGAAPTPDKKEVNPNGR
jgi:hypothetical protein